MRGDYSPGSPLGEVELARCFGVSRGPVREALIQLEREYLVRSFLWTCAQLHWLAEQARCTNEWPRPLRVVRYSHALRCSA